MANEVTSSWESEEIPGADLVFMRVHRTWVKPDGTIGRGAFQNRPTETDGMSTDWQKYSRPEDTRSRANSPAKDNAVIQFVVGEIRLIPDQTVIHTPKDGNRAHTDVFGEKHPEARIKLSRIYKTVIRLDQN